MQKTGFLLLFVCCTLFAPAQRSKAPAAYFTRTSELYLSDAEVDSLYDEQVLDFLQANNIPESAIQAVYPAIKKMLQAASKQKITQAFITLEERQKIKPIKDRGLPGFRMNRRLYVDAFRAEVRNVFKNNPSLSKYASINNSDRITSFNSTVRIGTDGKLLVTEVIRVHNGNGESGIYPDGTVNDAPVNNEIKRGIVRAFPLYYSNKYKLFQNTTFELKEVLRDGKKENYHTENKKNGVLVYTGSRDIFLDNGDYTYSITYETDRQLKFLNKYDELFWNVTGNSWSFKIDSASCTLILPKGAAPLSSQCYTGAQGDALSADCSFSQAAIGDSVIMVFKTTRALKPNTGFSVATSWPKGFVRSGPTMWQTMQYWIWNNKAVFFLPISALLASLFCFMFWFKYGRDPKKGVIYPLFEPPGGYSPAALGYIYNQKFSRKLTAATMVDAAVQHKIKIDVERDGLIFKHNEYVIRKSTQPQKKGTGTYEDFDSEVKDLLGSRIEKGKYNEALADLNRKIQNYCEDNYKGKDGKFKAGSKGIFALNSKYTILPGLICVAAGVWGFFELMRSIVIGNYWQIAYYIGGIILCVQVFNLFRRLLSAYSPQGRQLMDKIEGFRMFLSTADEKRFDMMSPPKKSLELYEKYLPFAIALDCENEWGNKFDEIIQTASVDPELAGTASFSQSMHRNSDGFGSSFASSFSGAISSASTPPGSSSGGGSSFGGGSSGGGGGGGGGGGW